MAVRLFDVLIAPNPYGFLGKFVERSSQCFLDQSQRQMLPLHKLRIPPVLSNEKAHD
jgi:hypothetical protein